MVDYDVCDTDVVTWPHICSGSGPPQCDIAVGGGVFHLLHLDGDLFIINPNGPGCFLLKQHSSNK
ncbi:hypothetical protein DPMN_156972 [Dreissena polymorpha]|uniref:Uncharacterized protein n=1 Tax=Dreissena polymorpha TaxID=45954 RepID=A0A9D4J991_DREPO|nr:hypothetical protein DPMN_156972 [Dreissena polymorpha]